MGLLKKITGGVKKVVNKVVPKELAGIMQVAAPFTGAAAPFVYAAGSLRQSGKINPMALASMALPYVGYKPGGTSGNAGLLGGLRYGDLKKYGTLGSDVFSARDLLGLRDASGIREKVEESLFGNWASGDQGFLGSGGDFDLKSGKLLSSTDAEGNIKLSKTKIAAAASAGLSLAQTQAQITEEAEGVGVGGSELAALQQEAAEMWEDFDTTQFKPKITAAIGGLMRKNLAGGTFNPATPKPGDYGVDENELKPEPKPFIPPPKPNKKMAMSYGYNDAMSDTYDLFLQMKRDKEIPIDMEFDIFLLEVVPEMSKGKKEGNTIMAANGGLMRTNYALGSMPTNEESGLGGLPIEADMRYSGGFMPYGEKEKADDVPARLSKNEFVFTADAVRAAGGGSIQKGAQKMYNSMKQLESMGRSVA